MDPPLGQLTHFIVSISPSHYFAAVVVPAMHVIEGGAIPTGTGIGWSNRSPGIFYL